LVGKLFRKIGGLEGYLRGYMSIEQIEVGIVGGLFLVITTDGLPNRLRIGNV